MKSQLLYVELKTGFSDNGPAWIGKGVFSKTGRSLYFNGQAFKKSNVISGNYFNIENRDEYWISGVKKDGTDSRASTLRKIQIDKNVVKEYLEHVNLAELPKNKFEITILENNPNKEVYNKRENEKLR